MFLNDFIARLLKDGHDQNMTEKQFLEQEIINWLPSPERRWQLEGYRYYHGDQNIDNKQRQIIGNGGVLQTVQNLPNNRLKDNRYSFLVDQKANYLLSKPIDVIADNEAAQECMKDQFGQKFRRTLKAIGKDAICGGISYLFPYVDGGELRFKRFRSFEILPFWADDEHTALDGFLRLYPQEVYEGMTKKIVHRVEWYKPEGVQKYTFEGNTLRPEGQDITPYLVVNDAEGDTGQGYVWDRVPLIVFKANAEEIPLIRRVKNLQDALNTLYSNFMDTMQEDARNTILVIHNYDGQDLGEFRQKLAQFGAVKVREGGGIDSLQIVVNGENYKAIIDLIKKAIIENGRGLDTKDDRLASGTPNQMNIRSMYTDLDLDADDMEMEFQAGLEDLMFFVNSYNASTGKPTSNVNFIFNRDTMTNESNSINDCRSSMGVISEETIVANHPWVKDSKEELKRIKEERQETLQQAMGPYVNQGGDNGQRTE